MVGSCFSVGVFCVGGALIALILKQYCSEHSMLLSIAVCASVFIAVVGMLEAPLDEVRRIFLTAGLSESYVSIIFKSLAICCITHIASEMCRDGGENAMASAAELWGRGAVTVLSLPLLKAFLQLIDKLL